MNTTRTKRWPVIAGVVALLVAHVAIALSASIDKTPGFDEVAHVAAGVSYWKFNDYRLHPENGNLPQRLAGAAIVPSGASFPDTNSVLWRESRVWDLGPEFLFRSGNDAQAILLRGRAAIALLSAVIGLVVFIWARRLFGTASGFVALTLWVFCPVALANAAMVTSDMAAALGLLVAAGAWWRVLGRVTPTNAILAGAATGVAMLSKMSGLLALPMAVMLVLIRLAASETPVAGWRELSLRPVTSRLRRLTLYAAVGVIAALVSGAMIWASFGFRHRAFAGPLSKGDRFLDAWVWTAPDAGGAARLASHMNNARLLPEAWLYGVAFQSWVNQQPTPVYLNGNWADRGFALFFPEVFALKMPIAFFVIAIFAGIVASRGRCTLSRLLPLMPLLVLIAVYLLAALTSPRNAGVRHLLPIYPAVFIFAGAAARLWGRDESDDHASATCSKRGVAVVTVLLIAFAGESLVAWPNYAAFFNPFAGGLANAHRIVADSSLDWGQELINLRRRLDTINAKQPDASPVYLAYFGTGSPEYYGISAVPLPGFGEPASMRRAPHAPEPLRPGTYCVSATLLHSLYVSPKGPWTQPFEASYKATSDLLTHLGRLAPSDRAAYLAQTGIADERTAFDVFEQLRFKRLCAYLRSREPDDHVNGSILIYRLDADELDRALRANPPELLAQPVIQP